MLKRKMKRSASYNEDGALPELIGKDLERNLDDTGKMEDDENQDDLEADVEETDDDVDVDEIEDTDDQEDIPDALDAEMEEPEEEFKDINEKVVVYLYRGFSELGDQVRLFVEDTENEDRDPDLVSTLEDFMEGYPEVMDVIKDLAKKYVTSVDLFDPEEEEEVTSDETEMEEPEDTEEDIEAEDLEVVESYVKENNLDHKVYENEYEIYARYNSSEMADKFESEMKAFKSAEVFRHEDIGEVHAYVRVK